MQTLTADQIRSKITELKQRDTAYAQKYGMSYETFMQNLETIEFVKKVEAEITKTWELDLIEWEFCHEGAKDWARALAAKSYSVQSDDEWQASIARMAGSLAHDPIEREAQGDYEEREELS